MISRQASQPMPACAMMQPAVFSVPGRELGRLGYFSENGGYSSVMSSHM